MEKNTFSGGSSGSGVTSRSAKRRQTGEDDNAYNRERHQERAFSLEDNETLQLRAKIHELNAKVASLEAEKCSFQLLINETKEQFIKTWDPVPKHLCLVFLSNGEGSLLEKRVLSEYPDFGVNQLEVELVKESLKTQVMLPRFFQGLKVLKLRVVEGNVHAFLKACLTTCKNLEKITLPFINDKIVIQTVVNYLRTTIAAGNVPIKEIDLECLKLYETKPDNTFCLNFQKFIAECANRGVWIYNPCSQWRITNFRGNSESGLGRCIKSLTMESNSSVSTLSALHLDHMENLVINWDEYKKQVKKIVVQLQQNEQSSSVKWTRLLKLDIRLKRDQYRDTNPDPPTECARFCQFLVEKSPNLTDLTVEGDESCISLLLQPSLLHQWPLQKLNLHKISGFCAFLEKSWPELPFLKELTLNGCPAYSCKAQKQKWNYKTKCSTFFGLKNLQKLWLKNLDWILCPCDQFLVKVLGNMQLTHVIINSKIPIPKASLVSVCKHLKQVRIASSIQEFSVDGWLLLWHISRDE